MMEVCRAKFEQNGQLGDLLLATKGTILVECSPWDHRWGIRCLKEDPCSDDHHKWKGANRLGFILSTLREKMIQDNSSQ